jgi:hypothetical protein
VRPRAVPSRREIALVGIAVAASTVFRLAVVSTWHNPAGDGVQYYALSQELRAEARFAYGPEPEPPTYTRLPGYPLFLAYLAVRQAPISLDAHLRRATRANVLLDAATALLVYALLRRWGRRPALVGLLLAFTCPLQLTLVCYGLTETLATALATLELWLALRILSGPSLAWPALAGITAGLAQLVRADAVMAAPAVAMAIFWSPTTLRRRRLAFGLAGAGAALVFAPWPMRNLALFGRPYLAAVAWRSIAGQPLPDTSVGWMRTWASGRPGESFLDLVFAVPLPADTRRPGILLPQMYDDPAERRRVSALFTRFTRESWSEPVVREFDALAQERTRRHPLRTFLWLPLKRISHLWSPVPEWELGMDVPWLGLPRLLWTFAFWYAALYVLALAGAIGLWRRGPGTFERRFAAVLTSVVGARTALYGYMVPAAVNSRYLIEAFPALIVLAAYGAAVTVPKWAAALDADDGSAQEAGAA